MITQIDEPVHAANQHTAANDIADGHGDQAGEEGRPRHRREVGGGCGDLSPIAAGPHDFISKPSGMMYMFAMECSKPAATQAEIGNNTAET